MRANGFITFFAESLALCHIPDGIYQLYDIILDLEIVTRPCSYVKKTIQGNFMANWHIISDHLEISLILYFFWLQIWVHFFRSFVTFGLFRAYNKYLQHSNEFRCEFGCNWNVLVFFHRKMAILIWRAWIMIKVARKSANLKTEIVVNQKTEVVANRKTGKVTFQRIDFQFDHPKQLRQ